MIVAQVTEASLAARDRKPGRPTPVSGAAQLAWVDTATDLVKWGRARALVTGPVSKEAIARSGATTAGSSTWFAGRISTSAAIPSPSVTNPTVVGRRSVRATTSAHSESPVAKTASLEAW